jgi:hypothetical protein
MFLDQTLKCENAGRSRIDRIAMVGFFTGVMKTLLGVPPGVVPAVKRETKKERRNDSGMDDSVLPKNVMLELLELLDSKPKCLTLPTIFSGQQTDVRTRPLSYAIKTSWWDNMKKYRAIG